jgi:hypothetical protein
MTKQDIIKAYVRMREVDHTIPSEVLDFMKHASLEKIENNKAIPLMAVEFGYKQCEKGHNLGAALRNFAELNLL